MSGAGDLGPSPGSMPWRELSRALAAALATPLRTLGYLARRSDLRREIAADLSPSEVRVESPDVPPLPARPLRVFVSAAEASGELHATRLVESLAALVDGRGAPAPSVRGFGGERLAAAGVERLADPVRRAAMGFEGIVAALPFYMDLVRRAAEAFRTFRPDVFVPVDSPALHVPLARVAQRYGVPVVHFVTPQYWGWAPWRVAAYRRVVDRALTILPFEPAWFGRRGVAAAHVGHPLLDTLGPAPELSSRDRGPLALLPGSRAGVIERNLPWMLRAAARLREETGALEVVVVQDDASHAPRIEAHLAPHRAFARLEAGDLHASLARARAALSISGTVLVDVLHQRLPTVVVYRLRTRRELWMYRNLLTVPWFASVNLLAGEELLPEFCFRGEGPTEEVGRALERCYKDADWRARCARGLELAARRLGPPGACERAARHALEVALSRSSPAAPGNR